MLLGRVVTSMIMYIGSHITARKDSSPLEIKKCSSVKLAQVNELSKDENVVESVTR